MFKTNSFFENNYVSGVIASLIAIVLIEVYKYYQRRCKNSKFKKVFGYYDLDKLNLVLPLLRVRTDVINFLSEEKFHDARFPLTKGNNVNINAPSGLVAEKDNTSLKYLLDIISSYLGDKSRIVSDEELTRHIDLSFISFGGSSFYFNYVLNSEENNFYHLQNSEFVNKQDSTKRFGFSSEFDMGLIIKLKDKSFPNRVWIIIGGLGESGTSGAGWYLSKNWEKLSDTYSNKAFGLIIRVKNGVDESAILMDALSQ